MRYVAGLMYSEDLSKVAMVLKNRPEWQAGKFNAIGGKIEHDEDPAAAMVREFREETGVQTSQHDWEFFTNLQGPWGSVMFFLMRDDRVFEVKTMEDEEIHIIGVRDLPHNIIGNLRWIIPMSLDSAVIPPLSIKCV